MKQTRLTYEQRRNQARERLLQAAHEMFVKMGFASPNVEDIANAAGYSCGASYCNFGGESESLIEVLRRDDDSALADLEALIETLDTLEEMAASAVEYCGECCHDDDWFPLWVEANLLV